MQHHGAELRNSFQGIIYGDLVGAPYMIENTYNKYFDLGQSNRAFHKGRVRTFFPSTTEATYGCAAVCGWLSHNREKPTIESLQERLQDFYSRHPRGGWTEPTRMSLSADSVLISNTPSWGAAIRALPVASFLRDNLEKTLELTESCVMATCSDEDTIRAGRVISHAAFLCLNGCSKEEVRDILTERYGLNLHKPEEDIRAELRGEVKVPIEIMGQEIEGAYQYAMPKSPSPLSPTLIVETALQALAGSGSWEDAVRMAVAYGGPSNAIAGLAGGLAEAIYGEVTQSVIGKLFAQIPTDIHTSIQIYEKSGEIRVNTDNNSYRSIRKDILPIINFGPGMTVYIVPKDRNDIRQLIGKTFPNPIIITPSESGSLEQSYMPNKTGAYMYDKVPERRTLYIQDGRKIVSPTAYVAPGMPPRQQRDIHLKAFHELRHWCKDRQRDMNRHAHNPVNCQIHYEAAYHMWIGSSRIDFFMGDHLAGRIRLDDKGLLRVELGEYRDYSQDARFENHARQSWETHSLFSIAHTVNPLTHIESIKEAIESRLLDTGIEEGHISNLDRLYALEGIEMEIAAKYDDTAQSHRSHDIPETAPDEPTGKQTVKTIYSLGYGLRSEKQFIETLHATGIDTLVDVRSYRQGCRNEFYNEDNLYESLAANGIAYINGGEILGARHTDRALLSGLGHVDWEKVRATEDYRKGIKSLESLSDRGQLVAIMCTEGNPLTCHRFGLVSRDLAADGYQMKHILQNGEVVSQEILEGRLLQKYIEKNRVPSVMTGTYKEQLDEAYRAMNQDHGHKPALKRKSGFRKRIKP